MDIIVSKSLCLFFVVICSWAFIGLSQGDGGPGSSLPCVQKLLPCQPYLKGSSAPPASCCVPLKQIVSDDTQCLCAVFNDPAILKGLNVTQADALALAKSCGANADTSLCTKAASPTAPATPTSNSSTTDSPTTNAGTNTNVISQAGLFLALAAILSSVMFSAAL